MVKETIFLYIQKIVIEIRIRSIVETGFNEIVKICKIKSMKIKETKALQENRLRDISNQKGIDYDSLKSMIESVRTKKLLKRNNYHQQKINDIIEKATK